MVDGKEKEEFNPRSGSNLGNSPLSDSSPEDTGTPSAWEPLRVPVFRALWTATVISNVGTWMQNVGAAWMMTTLAPSPLMVSLVQSATSLPVFLLGLPAGALADLMDRRRLLLVTQAWMLAAAAVLGILTVTEGVTPWALLILTFLLGIGAALNAPAWQAIIPELVDPPLFSPAIALNSVGYNLARVVGPALGGIIIATLGAGANFLLNAVSFLGVIVVLYRWRRPPRNAIMPAERVAGAVRTGLRYIRYSPQFQAVLIRAGLFMFFASALWALLPLIAKEMGHGSTTYGVLVGSLGVGAVIGSLLLPPLRKKVSLDQIVAGGTSIFAVSVVGLAFLRDYSLLVISMATGGVGWMFMMASMNVAAQTSSPAWVRARALATFILIFQGGLAGGSAFWGAVAEHTGIAQALLLAALGLAATFAARLRWPLKEVNYLNLAPSLHWRHPEMPGWVRPDLGPVLVTVEYRIDPDRADEFVTTMRELSRIRRRDGAISWGLFTDPSKPGWYLETFLVESWAEHMRQHARVTVADRELENRVLAFHLDDRPPVISHLVHAAGENGKEKS